MTFSTHPRYKRQITIVIRDSNYSVDADATVPTAMWTRKHYNPNDSHTLELVLAGNKKIEYDKAKWVAAFTGCTAATRIYVIGHCEAGSQNLSEEEKNIPAKIIARIIAQQIFLYSMDPALRISTAVAGLKLRISLLACETGLPDLNHPYQGINVGQVNNSFASVFLHYLTEKGLRCDVAARLGDIVLRTDYEVVDSDMSKLFVYEAEPQTFPDHDFRSKVIYDRPDGSQYQIIRQAYAPKNPHDAWRGKVFEVLANCMANTKISEKKRFLQHLMTQFMTKFTGEIYSQLGFEMNKSHILHAHSSFFSPGKTRTFSKLSQLLREFPLTNN